MRRVAEEDVQRIRRDGLKLSEHYLKRELTRIDFAAAKEIFDHGELYSEGKTKFRAVIPYGKGKIIYVLFSRKFGTNELITVGVTTRKKRWG